MNRVQESLQTIKNNVLSKRAAGAVLATAAVLPAPSALAQKTDTSKDVIAHISYEHVLPVTSADEIKVARSHPHTNQLRVTFDAVGIPKPFYGPVKDSAFVDNDIFGYTARFQSIDDRINKEQCELKLSGSKAHVNAGYPGSNFTAYAFAHGYMRKVPMSFDPGDEHLHANVGDVPTGVNPTNGLFAVFGGKRYLLTGDVTYMNNGNLLEKPENLRLNIPAEVGIPTIDRDRFSC